LSCNLGILTSWNPLGHSRPVTGLLYLYISYYTYGKRKGAYGVLVENLQDRQCWEDLGVDWRIIFKLIFKKWNFGGRGGRLLD
jgi:hypothetical protein